MTDLLPFHRFKGMAKDKTSLYCFLNFISESSMLSIRVTYYKVGFGKNIFQRYVLEFYRGKRSLNQFICFLRVDALGAWHVNVKESLCSGCLQTFVSYSE